MDIHPLELVGMPDLDKLVSILDRNNSHVGMGVAIGIDRLVTCAHVVNKALGRHEFDDRKPTTNELIPIKRIGSNASSSGTKTPLRMRVEHWIPPTEGYGIDLATIKFVRQPSSRGGFSPAT